MNNSKLYETLIHNIGISLKHCINETTTNIEHPYMRLKPIKFTDFMYAIDMGEIIDKQPVKKFILSTHMDYIIGHYPQVYGNISDYVNANQYYVIYGNDITSNNQLFSMKELEKTIKRSGIIKQFKTNDNNDISMMAICVSGIFCMYKTSDVSYWCIIAKPEWFNKRNMFI